MKKGKDTKEKKEKLNKGIIQEFVPENKRR